MYVEVPTSERQADAHDASPCHKGRSSRVGRGRPLANHIRVRSFVAIVAVLAMTVVALRSYDPADDVRISSGGDGILAAFDKNSTFDRNVSNFDGNIPTLDGNVSTFDGSFIGDDEDGGEIGELLASAAGVYRDAERREQHGMENTILLTSSNSGMQHFLENWICHANRLNYTFLVHSLDQKLHEDLTARGIPSIVIHESSSKFFKFGETAYHSIVKMKLDVVMLALRHGYDVFFSDVDIGFFNDPFPLFRRDCDFEFQTQQFVPESDGIAMRHVNTGFYYAKSNARALELLNAVSTDGQDTDDQTIWNAIMDKRSMSPLLPDEAKESDGDVRLLDPLRIVPGNAVQADRSAYLSAAEHADFSLADIGVVHANFVVGQDMKFGILQGTGTWLYKQGEACKPFALGDAAKAAEAYLSR